MSSRASEINHPQKKQEERKSMLSNSSGGSSTLMDAISQNQKRQKVYLSATQSNQQQNLRKFTSAISKPGQARETRELITKVLSTVNSIRPALLAEPIDYERFITEKSAQLENDRDRDLLLFFRDDISGSEVYPKERTAVPTVRHRDINETDWLLPRDALKFYISPCIIINFNYTNYAGEFKKFDFAQNLNYLRFESDMIFEEEKSQFAEQSTLNEILREGNMMVFPGESIVDSFKSEKKRYCILRRSDDGKIYLEIYKQASLQQQIYPPMEIISAQIKTTKKGKTLQITSSDSEKTLILSTENESNLQFWLFEIDRAITWRSKDIITSEDNTSLNSSIRENSIPPSQQDSESVASEESIGGRDSITMWRGKNAAAKALQPPLVERNNIFSLYWDMEPLPEPDGERSTLSELLNEIETSNAKKIQPISSLSTQPKKSTSMNSTTFSDDGSSIGSIRETSPDPSTSDFLGEKPAILFIAQIRQLDIKTRFSCKETPEQIEPFFLRLFVFDASIGTRLSEEFHIEVPTQRFTELRSSSAIIASKQILPERIHGISRNRIQAAEKLICAIQNPRPDLYLVAFIERILSDIPIDIYLKNNVIDAKASVKIQKSISASFLRLNHVRTLLGWTATPIFPQLCSNRNFVATNSNIRNCQIYKCDGKMTDIDLQKLLMDLQKPEKVAKWIFFPSANLNLEADVTSVLSQIPMRISSNYYPLRPWRVTTPDKIPLTPSFELQSFSSDLSVEPQRGYTNLLYVYPISLNYSTQKSFPKARNILCKIRFIQSKMRQIENNFMQIHPIYNRIDPNGPLVQSFNCSVQYHESAPSFNEEVKIQLPPSLDHTDHLLFTFTHVSLATALSSKQSQANDTYETFIGYSWLPLARENAMGLPNFIMSENCQEFDLLVAANLPQNYIDANIVNGKEGSSCSNVEIKLVENGKHLFRVRLRLISTIFTTEERIQNFFQLCQYTYSSLNKSTTLNDTKSLDSMPKIQQKLYNSISNENACSASDLQEKLSPNHEQSLNFELKLINIIQELTLVDIDRIIPFFEVILNRLFSLITLSRTGLAITSLNAIIKLVDCLYMRRKSKRYILRNYIRLHFNASIAIEENDENEQETLHGAILRFFPSLIQRCKENNATNELPPLFRQLWFLLDCVTKSLAHWLILSNLIKAPRSLRFPNELYFCLEEFFQSLTQQIVDKHNKLKTESRFANLALAHFINVCLSLMDRHQIMKELYEIVKRMDAVDSRNFRIYKFELLQILSWHEHWIPLCLPLLTDKYGIVMRADTIMLEGFPQRQNQTKNLAAGGGFFSKLFSHIFSPPYPPHESNEIERYSTSYSEHFYLSETYCSTHFLIGLLFQELSNSLRDSREYRRKIIRLLKNLLVKHYRDKRYGDASAKNRIATLYIPLLRFIIEHVRELEVTIKGRNDSPIHSPIIGAKGNYSSDRYSSMTSNSSSTDLIRRSKLNIPPFHEDGKSVLTTNSYNSNSTMTKESIKIGKEKTKNHLVVVLAEKLDKSEVRDLVVSCLYLLNNLPKKILAAFWNAQDSIQTPKKGRSADGNSSRKQEDACIDQQTQSTQNILLDFIRFLEFSLLTFRYRGRSYHIMQQAKRSKSKDGTAINFESTYDSYKSFGTGGQFSTLTDFADSIGHSAEEDTQNGVLLDCHLSQEVALIILETIQTISNQVASKTKYSSSKYYDAIFFRLLNLELEMLNEGWSETVRLQTLAALAVFINLFSSRFFHSGPLDCLSTLVKALLLQLNSRIPRIQNSAAALIQLILRGGFDASNSFSSKLSSSELQFSAQKNQPNYSTFVTEKLGRPGAQISVALARLLSEKKLETYRFERGLTKIESLVAGDKHNNSSLIVTSLFERAVLELVKQLRGVLDATRAITDMTNNPIQLADLHIQLADSYRGSAALRSEFFDALANIHISEGWYSEGAICQAHSLAIIGKELQAKGMLNADWSLLNILNETIAIEEEMQKNNASSTQQGGFTLDEFTRKVEDLVRTLVLSERYEAVGPIYRLAIPIFESQFDFKALMEIYAELQQASSRAAEIKINGKRHLGSYFKIVFYGQNHFADEHKTEWIYREPRLTSLAEACDRMVELVRLALGHDQVRILNERMGKNDDQQLDSNIAFIQVAYVEPCQSEEILRKLKNGDGANDKLLDKINDPMNYSAHTNVRTFIQEEKLMDQKVGENEPEMARTALRRLILTVEKQFPNTRRRQRIIRTEEMILTPLELACESLLFKASQIRRILAAADVPKLHFGVYDKETLKRLDLKQLQLFLQGSVSPTVNAGLLAYAEAFTAPTQKQRYGKNGIGRLISAFKTLITELDDALRVNEAAMAGERMEYQGMLRQSFDGMLERLSMFFDGEKFLQRPGEENTSGNDKDILSLSVFGNRTGSSAEMHIFDTISGLNS